MLNSTIATVVDVIMFYEALGKIRQSLYTGGFLWGEGDIV